MDLFALDRVPFLARRNFYFEMQHILLWGMVVGVVEGNFAAVVVSKTFGGGDLLITIAATTPLAAHMASLLWGMLCVGRRKIQLFTICTAGTTLCIGSIAAAPTGSLGAWVFVAQMAVAQFFLSGAVTVRSALWKSNYPRAVRGQIAARLQIIRSVTRISAVALAAFLFDMNPLIYQWLYPAVALAGAVAVGRARRIRVRGEARELARRRVDSPVHADDLVERVSLAAVLSPRIVWVRAMRVLRADARFRHYCVAQMFAGCANLMVRSVVVAVLTKRLLVDLRREYWTSAVLIEVLPLLLMLATMSRFARYFDRVGVVRFRVYHGMCWTAAILMGMAGTLAVVYAEHLGPYALVLGVSCFAMFAVIRGVCLGGGSIAWNLGHLHFAREQDAEVYMGIHVSLTGLRGLIMPTLGMIIWRVAGWPVWLCAAGLSVASVLGYLLLDRMERSTPVSDDGPHDVPGPRLKRVGH